MLLKTEVLSAEADHGNSTYMLEALRPFDNLPAHSGDPNKIESSIVHHRLPSCVF